MPHLGAAPYAKFLDEHYLRSFIADGGSAVKFAAADTSGVTTVLREEITLRARASGYATVFVDARRSRVSLVQNVFYAASAEIPWRQTSSAVVRRVATERLGVTVDGTPSLDAIVASAAVQPFLGRIEMLRGLEGAVSQNYELAKDFRLAMAAYCEAVVQAGGEGRQTRATIEDWLRGELRSLGAMRQFGIFQKIGRNNARLMISSTSGWLRQAGWPGLVIVLDIWQLAATTRREAGHGHYYSPAAVMDAYEVLRQFVDETGDVSGLFLLVLVPEHLLTDDRRGIQGYTALRNRIWDDVRDRAVANPFSPMVRLGAKHA